MEFRGQAASFSQQRAPANQSQAFLWQCLLQYQLILFKKIEFHSFLVIL